jgi:hypothetical protein
VGSVQYVEHVYIALHAGHHWAVLADKQLFHIAALVLPPSAFIHQHQ